MTGQDTAKNCARCQRPVPAEMPREGVRQTVRLRRETYGWRLRFRWLPENPADRARESYTPLDLCDWCAGDVFLFAQGLSPRSDEDRARASQRIPA
jgi:hypothetical protein